MPGWRWKAIDEL